jgi:hypothetical protein
VLPPPPVLPSLLPAVVLRGAAAAVAAAAAAAATIPATGTDAAARPRSVLPRGPHGNPGGCLALPSAAPAALPLLYAARPVEIVERLGATATTAGKCGLLLRVARLLPSMLGLWPCGRKLGLSCSCEPPSMPPGGPYAPERPTLREARPLDPALGRPEEPGRVGKPGALLALAPEAGKLRPEVAAPSVLLLVLRSRETISTASAAASQLSARSWRRSCSLLALRSDLAEPCKRIEWQDDRVCSTKVRSGWGW